MHNIINADAENNPGKNIVLATCWKDVEEHDPSIYSWATNLTCKYDSVIQEKFQHTEPVILYVLMPENNLTVQERKFISDFNAHQVLQWSGGNVSGGGTLYRTYLQ